MFFNNNNMDDDAFWHNIDHEEQVISEEEVVNSDSDEEPRSKESRIDYKLICSFEKEEQLEAWLDEDNQSCWIRLLILNFFYTFKFEISVIFRNETRGAVTRYRCTY